MDRVLVTGGAGYIGSVLVEELLKLNYQVTVLDNFMYGQNSILHLVHHKNLNIIKGDVRDRSLMRDLIAESDVVVPLAAIVGAPACDKDPWLASSVNKQSVLSMLEMVSNDQRILMPTTNSAYGSGDDDNECDENSPLKPISLYAREKVEVESALMQFTGATSYRLATVFGMSPRMRLDLLVNDFVRRALVDGFVVLFEGHFKRNYIHVRDVVAAFILALKFPSQFVGEVFNVGLSSANLSKVELCERIKKVIPNFVFMEAPLHRDPDQRNYVVSNAKIEARGFAPTYDLEAGIRELVKGIPLMNTRNFTNLK